MTTIISLFIVWFGKFQKKKFSPDKLAQEKELGVPFSGVIQDPAGCFLM